tara:strand:- start:479 stop:913 length:435 start_codon:yes stop_codon:yes gene_type:complete
MRRGIHHKKTNVLVLFLLGIGAVLIFYLSWKVDPNLEETSFIPEWLAEWADNAHNDRKRTGVPFIGLGILLGGYLLYVGKSTVNNWSIAWLIMIIVVGIAELGQYFLPSRSPDIEDIIWGGLGAGVGLALPWCARFIWRFLKTN